MPIVTGGFNNDLDPPFQNDAFVLLRIAIGMFHGFTFPKSFHALVVATLYVTSAFFVTTSAGAATFRVTTKIFEGGKTEPSAEHWILFDNGLVYDLPQKGAPYVTVYDPAQQRVTLLHREDQIQTSLSTEDLERVTAQARAAATTAEQRERLGLTARVEPVESGYKIRFGNFEYHTTTQKPEDPTVAADYARFAILAKRLDIVRRVGPPPFGRMTLTQYIAAKKELPVETGLTIQRGDDREEYLSTQTVVPLTDSDREQIDEVRGMLTLYREVALSELP